MINFLEAIFSLMERHGDALKEFAVHEANGKVFKLSIQLTRLRTDVEQRVLLDKYYLETLDALQAQDDGPFSMIYYISNFLPNATITMKEVSATTQRFSEVFSETNVLKTIDFTNIASSELSEIPKDNIAHSVLEAYKNYAANEHFLEKIIETLNFLDTNKEGEKLTAEQLQKVTSPEELKDMLGPILQQALEPLYAKRRPQQINKPHINADEAAEYLNMAKSSLYKLTHKRLIRFYKPGKNVLFLKADLDEYLEKGEKKSVDQMKENKLKKNEAVTKKER